LDLNPFPIQVAVHDPVPGHFWIGNAYVDRKGLNVPTYEELFH